MMTWIHLPWPPSVNRYWRRVGAKTLISKEGRHYRYRVAELVSVARLAMNLEVPVEVSIVAYPPDKRVRDLDNLLKAPLDALTHAGVWADDSLIDRLAIERQWDDERAGTLAVAIRGIDDQGVPE